MNICAYQPHACNVIILSIFVIVTLCFVSCWSQNTGVAISEYLIRSNWLLHHWMSPLVHSTSGKALFYWETKQLHWCREADLVRWVKWTEVKWRNQPAPISELETFFFVTCSVTYQEHTHLMTSYYLLPTNKVKQCACTCSSSHHKRTGCFNLLWKNDERGKQTSLYPKACCAKNS